MKKLLLIALLMLTVVFAAVACTEPTEPVDTTAAETDAETTAAADAETTAATGDETTAEAGDETTAEETTAEETTAEETTAEETTAEETTAEETTAEETTAEETTAEDIEPEFESYISTDPTEFIDLNGGWQVVYIEDTDDILNYYFDIFSAQSPYANQPLQVQGPLPAERYGASAVYVFNATYGHISRDMDMAYAFTIDVATSRGPVHGRGFFVRGSSAMLSDNVWCGNAGSDGSYGGSGIYLNVRCDDNDQAQSLIVDVRSNPVGTVPNVDYTHNIYEFPIESDRITVADDGNTVYVIADGKLLCTIAISGTKAYADYNIAEGVIASTAIVTLADGTTETIENVACAASYGTLGVANRIVADVESFGWTYLAVESFDSCDIPAFPKVIIDKDTYVSGEAINVKNFGFGTDVLALFLKADFEALDFEKAIYAYQIGFDSGKTVNILDGMANPAMFAYHTVPAGEYVVALVNVAGTVIDSKVITVVGSTDVENPGEDAEDSVVVAPAGTPDVAPEDFSAISTEGGLNLGGVYTIYEFNLDVDGDYELQVSVDGGTWTTVTLTEDGKLTATVLAQYVRVVGGTVSAVEIKATFLGEPETDPETELETVPEPEPEFESYISTDPTEFIDPNGGYQVVYIPDTDDILNDYFEVFSAQSQYANNPLLVQGPLSAEVFGASAVYTFNATYGHISRDMDMAYAFTIDVATSSGPVHGRGFFVRGSSAMLSDKVWCGGAGSDGSYGGSGIYLNVRYDGNYQAHSLIVDVRSNPVVGTDSKFNYTHNIYEFPIESDRITVADDGNTVYVIADGKLLCTIAISGTKAYADYNIAEGVIASTAIVTLADGTSETIENVACAASYGTLGVANRIVAGPEGFGWTYLAVESFDSCDIPAFTDFYTYESDIMAWKPAGAVFNVYDILSTGDDMAGYFELDYLMANGYGIGIGLGALYHQDDPYGDYAWYLSKNSSVAMFKEMKKAYVYTVNMRGNEGSCSLDNSGIFVRGSEDLYTGSWAGKTGDNQGFGGSGIYFNFKYTEIGAPTHLVITLKSDVQGEGNEMTFIETTIEIEVEDDCLTIADDGNTVSVVVGGKLVATIAISGTKAYADRGIAEGVIASTAVVTLADGTTQTIENVACAAGFGTLGIGARTTDDTQFAFTSVKVDALSTYDVPEFAAN